MHLDFKKCLQVFLLNGSFSDTEFYYFSVDQSWYNGINVDWNHPPWPGTIVIICVSYLTAESPGKEHGSNKPLLTGRVQERSKGDTTCPATSQNPSCWHPSWLSNVCTTRKNPELQWLITDNLETNPIPTKPKTVSHVAEQFSRVPLHSCSPPGRPFPIKSLALSAGVSPQTIHFWVLDKSPLSGLGRGSPSYNVKMKLVT